jgi:hypothetical protein
MNGADTSFDDEGQNAHRMPVGASIEPGMVIREVDQMARPRAAP